jgi:hypothetical protein
MKLIIVPVILLSGCQSTSKQVAVESELTKCENEGALAFQYAVSKPFIMKSFSENPKKGNAGEAWRMLGFLHSEDEEYKKILHETKMKIAKEIVESGFTNGFRIDAFLLKDYYELSCDAIAQGKTILAVQELDKDKVLSCWDNHYSTGNVKSCLERVAFEPYKLFKTDANSWLGSASLHILTNNLKPLNGALAV